MFKTVEQGKLVLKDLTTSFNGRVLEEVVATADNSFKTIKVEGREPLEEHHDTTEVPGRHGLYYHGSVYRTRTIEVTAGLKAKTAPGYRELSSLLAAALSSSEPAWLAFSDEAGFGYFAKYQKTDVLVEEGTEAVIKLTFTCHDPFKYSTEKSATSSSNRLAITSQGDAETKPIVTATIRGSASEFRLLHVEKQQYIRLNRRMAVGEVVKVDFGTGTVTVNGTNVLPSFDMVNSRFFSLSKGRNTLNLNASGSLSVTYREVYL